MVLDRSRLLMMSILVRRSHLRLDNDQRLWWQRLDNCLRILRVIMLLSDHVAILVNCDLDVLAGAVWKGYWVLDWMRWIHRRYMFRSRFWLLSCDWIGTRLWSRSRIWTRLWGRSRIRTRRRDRSRIRTWRWNSLLRCLFDLWLGRSNRLFAKSMSFKSISGDNVVFHLACSVIRVLREVSVTRVVVLLLGVVVLDVMRWVPVWVLIVIDARFFIQVIVVRVTHWVIEVKQVVSMMPLEMSRVSIVVVVINVVAVMMIVVAMLPFSQVVLILGIMVAVTMAVALFAGETLLFNL